MTPIGKYTRCHVAGDGKLFVHGNSKAERFKIVDMSAAGIRLETTAPLLEGAQVTLKIRFIGGIVDAFMDANGKVIRTIDKGYEIEFTNLTDGARAEIEALMRDTCNIAD